MAFHGYNHESTLPIKAGMTVKVPKGATVWNLHRGHAPAGKAYSVKVHHVLPGRSVPVGHYYKNSDGTTRFVVLADRHLRRELEEKLGLKSDQDIENAVSTHGYTASPYAHDNALYAYINLQNPSVCWAGTGGYWSETDINNVL